MYRKPLTYLFVLTLAFSSCAPGIFSSLRSNDMEALELGMSREHVTGILGNAYTIAEKRMEDGILVEILSYRNFPNDDEFYLFVFKDNRLEEWYRELLPQYEFRE
ncbi:hypothetical protein [Cyclobacterium roseum]|uniref:hypothetical protein n=1 Tax=Cyclobacterium roseum TaxID=2666137 RepID=UPI00139154DE|nr:hypothetical protein [Cyclobacterium roseum]